MQKYNIILQKGLVMRLISKEKAEEQGLKVYFTGKSCKRGHTSGQYISSRTCVECQILQSEKWRKNNPEECRRKDREFRIKNRDYLNANQKEKNDRQKKENPEEFWKKVTLRSAKSRAKKNDLDFNLTMEDLVVPQYCPALNIKLKFARGKATDESPSIDRIDNNKGYTKDNICIISRRANRIKDNASLEEINLILKYIRKNLD